MDTNIKDTYLGFTDNLKPMQKVKAEKTLDNLIRCNDNIITNKEFIFIKLQEGLTPSIEEDYSYYSRKLQGDTKPKTDYRLKDQDASFYHITKTEYNYALYLLDNNFLDEQRVKEFIVVENNRLLQSAQDELNQKQQDKERKETLEREKQEFDNWLTEQAENYNNNDKLNLAKIIFLDKHGSYNELYLCKILILIDNINNITCKDKLINWLHSDNTTSKKVFYHITGIKLPSTNKGTMETLNELVLSDYQGIIPYRKKQQKVNKNIKTETFYKLVKKYPDYHFETVIGEPITKYELDMAIVQNNGEYSILESKSGALLVSKTNTKTELMSKLKSLIDHYGIEHTKKLIQDSIDKFGISPKYKDVV